jgi:ankyrin repeat protein
MVIREGADPNAVNRDGHSAMYLAVKGLHPLLVELLLDFNAQINISDKYLC